MDASRRSDDDKPDPPADGPVWQVDPKATAAQLLGPGDGPGGRLLYVDERGRQRRLPADPGTLSGPELAAAARATSRALGGGGPSLAQRMALEHLDRLHAAGRFSDEDYQREKRRLLGESR